MRKPSFLKHSPIRGTWSYRRDIPKKLVPLWGKTSEKVKLETKDYAQAYKRAAAINLEFDAKAKRLRQLLDGKPLSTEHLSEEARDILIREGIHPQQMPSTKEEADAFFQKQDEYKELYVNTIDTKHGYNTDGTIWTEYVEDPTNPYAEAFAVLHGKPSQSIVPTIKEATEMYLRVNARKKPRAPANQKKHEQRIWRAIDALGRSDDLITDFNRLKAQRHKEVLERSNQLLRADIQNR